MANNSLTSQTTNRKLIEVGKFYIVHDGSERGHPGLIIWADVSHNLYLAIKFGTTPSKNNSKFFYPLTTDIKCSYYYKRLFLGKRKNFGNADLSKLNILEEDLAILIKKFDFLNPRYSKDLNRKHKRYYKWAIKKSPLSGAIVKP